MFEHWLASQLRNFSFKFRPYVLTEAEKLRKKRAKEEKQAYIAKRGKKG